MRKFLLFLLIIAILSSAFLSGSMGSRSIYEKKEIWPFIHPRFVEFIPSSQKGLMADLLLVWVTQRSIENLNDIKKLNLDWLYHTLDIASLLDPNFLDTYLFGGVILPMGEREEIFVRGQSLLEKGLQRFPEDWHIPFWIGMNYYQKKKYILAAHYLTLASRKPNIPIQGVDSLAILCYYYGGGINTAIKLVEALRESVKSHHKKNILTRKIKWLENIIFLQKLVDIFKEKFKRLPANLEELRQKNLTPFLPEDPFYNSYYLDKETGSVKSYISSKPSY